MLSEVRKAYKRNWRLYARIMPRPLAEMVRKRDE